MASISAYTGVFFGLLVVGETVLVPALYATTIGLFDLALLIPVVLSAQLLADSGWYAVGRFMPEDRLKSLPFADRAQRSRVYLSRIFDRRQMLVVFGSKFVYGSRIAVRVLAGIRHMPFGKFFAANVAGNVLWDIFLFGLIVFVNLSITSVESITRRLEVSFGIVAAITIAHHILTKYVLKQSEKNTSHVPAE